MASFQQFIEYHRLKGLQADDLLRIPEWTTANRPTGGDLTAALIGINDDITSYPILEWYDGTTWRQAGATVTETDPVFTASFVSNITSLGAGLNLSGGVLSSLITQYTDAMARAALSLTTSGTGAATYDSSTGVLNIPVASGYTLPTASDTVLGGIKVGSGLSISGSGVLSVNGSLRATLSGSTWDFTTGNILEITLTADLTLSITNLNDLDVGVLIVHQDEVGGWTLTVDGTLPNNWEILDGAGDMTTATFIYNTDTLNWSMVAQYTAPPVPLDSVVTAAVAAATTKYGVAPTTAEQYALNDFILSLKSGVNTWAQVHYLYAFGGFGLINIANPVDSDAAYRAVAPNGMTIDANGRLVVNGTNQYLDSKFNQSINGVTASESFAWYNSINTDSGYDAGTYISGTGILLISRASGSTYCRIEQASDVAVSTSTTSSIGTWIYNLVDTGGGNGTRRVYKNGTQLGSDINTTVAAAVNQTEFWGCFSSATTPSTFKNAGYGIIWRGKQLSTSQVTQLNSAIGTYIAATSRT